MRNKSLLWVGAITIFLTFTFSCKPKTRYVVHLRNDNYERLFEAVSKADPVCDKKNGIVWLSQLEEFRPVDGNASDKKSGKLTLRYRKMTRYVDDVELLKILVEEIHDDKFMFTYTMELETMVDTDTYLHLDKGRLRCRCRSMD